MDENTHPLALARAACGMTGVEFAVAVRAAAVRRGLRSGVDKQRVRKWELGVTPDRISQTYIAEALGLPADAPARVQWPAWLPNADGGVIPLGPSSTVPALREALSTAMDTRRNFIVAISGTALTALAASWSSSDTRALAQAQDGKSIGDDLVAFLEDTSAKLTALATEQRQHTAPLLDAHLETVTGLIADGRYTTATGLRLHALAARLSQTVAWHRFDLGQHSAASRYWIAGLHSAHASGDHDMGAALLGDLAYQASWRKDSRTAAGILEHALARTEHPAARSLLNLRLARAHAAQGERRSTLRALNAAEHLLATASGRPMPAWCAWLSEADLAVDSGQALLDLGDTARAHQLIGEGQGLLPTSRDKTRGVFMAYRADSHLGLDEPELAAAAAREALALAQRIGAPRCVQLVMDLLPQFQPYAGAEGVPELLALARA
ncbi:XRE family transcriptional regulator [Streptomyces sp. NPDC056638]|uniref:XRE family transcriptional regulator n=1 Tax=Streptomyces sp. NPDC056638 TaxID=3345887 RepID=UPI0036BCC2B3